MKPRTKRRRSLGAPPSRQRGIALLVAILLVAMGTLIAAGVAYENAKTARYGAASFAFEQSILVGQAAETLAAWGLREVKKVDAQHTYIGQGWDKPVGPVEVVPDVMLTASLEDVTGRFNLNSLVNVQDGLADPVALAAFQQLLSSLGIEPKWAGYVVDWIDPDSAPSNPDGAEDSVYLGQDPPYRTPNMYITSTTELLALPGFGKDRYKKLAPFITALPVDAKINVCTAPGAVLDAFIPGRQEFGLDPEGLAKSRAAANGCFPKLTDYQAAFGSAKQFPADRFAMTSSYFKLTSYITIGTTEFNLYSLLFQDPSGMSRAILRSYTPD
jgi:general secretion pathway protein K